MATWAGSPPTKCDVCSVDINDVFYDASVRGTWGIVCPTCFVGYDCKLGTGKGQEYRYFGKDRGWIKVAG